MKEEKKSFTQENLHSIIGQVRAITRTLITAASGPAIEVSATDEEVEAQGIR